MELEYNTDREPLLLKEYGRNVQKLVEHIVKEEDDQKRLEQSTTLVKLMTQLNPSVKSNADNLQRIWDHMHIMSDFKLNVDAPFPPPNKDITIQTPDKVEYRGGEMALRHYGRNLELAIQKVIEIEEKEERDDACIQIARTMKSFYFAWYKEILDDVSLINDLKKLSKGAIDLAEAHAQEPKLFDMHLSNTSSLRNDQGSSNNNKRNKGKRRRRK